jgi:hypothetical protein
MNTLVFAVLSGVGVLLAGNLPWAAVSALNLRILTSIPWVIVPMAIYLWVYWSYIGGRLGSPATADERRLRLRANSLSSDLWVRALVTGLFGFAALLALLTVMARLIAMPPSAPIVMPPGMPAITGLLLLVMSSCVAGITEEAAFRGYMQGPIEQRYGLMPAILVNGTMFGLLHFPNHPDAVLTMLPYYIAVAAVYGGLTWACNSILPALVLHAGGDIWSLTRLWITGHPEWQLATTPSLLVWDTGPDVSFVASIAALVITTMVTVILCRSLKKMESKKNGVGDK